MAVICMLSMLQNIQYYLQMGHGESSTYYGGPWLIPFQGGGQGNGAAPGFWITISIVLVRYLTSWGHAEAINFAISASAVMFSAILFMDDMDLPVISRQGEMSEALLAQAQWKVLDWQRGLCITGEISRWQNVIGAGSTSVGKRDSRSIPQSISSRDCYS